MRIDNQSLNTQLSIVKSGRAARSVAGATSGFLLEERDNHLALVSTNLVSETSCLVKAVDVKGACAYVPAELAEIVEKCSGDPVQLKLTATRAEVTIGGTKAKLPIQSGDVFPRLTLGQEKSKFSINSAALKNALFDTINFAPTNDPRTFLNGVLVVVRTGSVLCVATNGHMMSISTEAADVTVPAEIQRILPVAAVRQLLRILDIGAVTEVVDGDNAMLFKCGLVRV
jgi:DNA polymerase III sliding clamp (beta) subunit (PCNA family)